MSKSTIFFRFVAPLLFLVCGGAALAFGVQERLLMRAASRWDSTEGVVESSQVRAEVRESRRNGRTRSHHAYSAEVVYRFTVGGEPFRGDRLRFAAVEMDSPDAAEREIAAYPPGRTVTVFYDPQRPSESVLEREAGPSAFLLPALGGLFVIAGLAMAYLFNRRTGARPL